MLEQSVAAMPGEMMACRDIPGKAEGGAYYILEELRCYEHMQEMEAYLDYWLDIVPALTIFRVDHQSSIRRKRPVTQLALIKI